MLEGLSSSNPSENTPYISSRLSHYDLINVQEDFNYHAALYASDSHLYRTPTSGGAAIGSGLNTLSNFPYIDLVRTTWNDCNLNSGDCLTPKGFTSLRIQLGTSQWLDVYNLHTDAGSESGDLSARAKNIAQLLAFMENYSAGMPVIVMGDTNMRYTTIGDSARLFSEAGFTDAWVELWRNNTAPAATGTALTCAFPFPSGTTPEQMMSCEMVDKIFYRSSAVLSLDATSMGNEDDAFLHPTNGTPLSDHYPLTASIEYDDADDLRLSDVVGGPHGDWFNDVTIMAGGVKRLTKLTLAGGERVDSVAVENDGLAARTWGGTGGTARSIALAAGEGITEVKACQGQKDGNTRVFYLQVTMSAGRTLAAGKETSDCKTLTAPSGFMAVGFWGRSGNEVDRIGVIWGKL